MKIYVVTSGYYSDRTIQQVFLNKQKAETYCAAHNKSCNNNYDKLEIYGCYETYDDMIAVADDRVVHGWCYFPKTPLGGELLEYKGVMLESNASPEHWNLTKMEFHTDTDDEEKAFKIARDKYAQYKAELAGL